MQLTVPYRVETIIQTLEKAGFEAYAVGGCVRDSILGRTPDDWDITTSAKPEQVKRLFRRTVDTGLAHGTVTVLVDKEGFEVTTYRVDGEYEDARHPKEVTFTASLEEDLKRRDFTINAMAYNPARGLVDMFGGAEDLERKIIRCVGNPLERFTEDALRILRAVRFSAQLGFAIEEDTEKALAVLAPNLKHVSAERIQAELLKLLLSPNPDYLRTAYEAGITAQFLPEWDVCMVTEQNTPHHCFNVGEHTLQSLKNIRSDKVLRLTMLLHDIGKPVVRKTDENGRDHFKTHGAAGEKMAGAIMRRLKLDNDTVRKVCRLIKWHDYRPKAEPVDVRKAVHMIGEDIFPLFLEIQRADMLAQSEYRREQKLNRLDGVDQIYQEIIREGQCVSLKKLAVSGKDLLEAGYGPGKQIGEILELLLEEVLINPHINKKEELLGMAKEKFPVPDN
ncbi:MAG: CCA tRNA nucleotidyltransferase [Eubacteriales bacterium]|nr:CCA tRNA nucleotidyltransferase [Eubacteriales bacterium]